WDHVDELRELPLPIAQCRFSGHQIVYVYAYAVPLDDRPCWVAQRLGPPLGPPIDAIGSPLSISLREDGACLEGADQRLPDHLPVIRMNVGERARCIRR